MSLVQLSYFIAVAEEQHLTRAALRLHISQPPLTRQMRALEEELETQLFERTNRGMRLLPAGRLFLEKAKEVVSCVDDLRETMKRASSKECPLRLHDVPQRAR